MLIFYCIKEQMQVNKEFLKINMSSLYSHHHDHRYSLSFQILSCTFCLFQFGLNVFFLFCGTVVLHLKFAMYSICLTAHLEFENWKHILSFVFCFFTNQHPLNFGEGELGKLVPEVLVRGQRYQFEVFLSLNHLLLHKNCRGQ